MKEKNTRYTEKNKKQDRKAPSREKRAGEDEGKKAGGYKEERTRERGEKGVGRDEGKKAGGYREERTGEYQGKRAGGYREERTEKYEGKRVSEYEEKRTGGYVGTQKTTYKKETGTNKGRRLTADNSTQKQEIRERRPAGKIRKKKEGCPLASKCGGCTYQGISYEQQLAAKEKQVRILMKDICRVSPIIGMEHPYHYRNKVHAVFDRLRDGTVISGIYKQGTHIVIPVDHCLIEDEKADAIIHDIRGMLKSFKIKTYDEDTGYGLLRHVLIRTGFQSGQIMVVLVIGSPAFPSKNNFVKALRKLHPEISTIVLNVNSKKTSMVLGDRDIPIFGPGYIEDTLCNITFRISPQSFYQVNPVQTEILYEKAIELAGLSGKERVIDAYCGIGTIGLIASKNAKEVISIELNKDAVRDAVQNAKCNGIKNVRFYEADAGQFMTRMAGHGEKADVVFMDPPRAGSDEAFLSSLVSLAPKKVVYISCNPETLARDVKYLRRHGYQVETVIPVDMFPWAGHVESVCLMTRKAK